MANPQAENGFTRIANEIMDVLCYFRIPGECWRVLISILRKTYGFHKTEDWISNSQLIEVTRMSKGNVSRSLSKLITHKVVIISDNKLRLNKNYEEWISFGELSKVITDKVVIKTDTKVIKSDTSPTHEKLSEVRDTKDITKENIQKKEKNSSNDQNLSSEDLLNIRRNKKPKTKFGFVFPKFEKKEYVKKGGTFDATNIY